MKNNRDWYLQGAHDGIPIAMGYLAVSFTLGIAARNVGLGAFPASLMSITNLPYDPRMRERVQELRHKMTPMEKKLWYSFLRTYPVKMYKQRPIRTFVADFYCPLARLVIELDGSQHYTEQGMQYDKERSAVFEQYGVQVLRFRNQDVSAHFEMVCEQIHEAVVKRLEELERGKEG